ncbi:MAG TPA: ATP12 family protein [Xanthobacteraceae bacterium]|nr:ATP12 family protein [Xanthobacteraceae bacterium]
MRDIFEDIFTNQPLDPMEAARRNARPSLRKRFYAAVAVAPQDDGSFAIELDGKPVRTPARNVLAAPTRALADALADEWRAQDDVIDPARMPLTRLANTIIDAVTAAREEVAAEVAKYLGSDLVCYRADQPAGLVARQSAQWDPVLDWAREELGARFVLTTGITHVAQPQEAIAAVSGTIPQDAWRLGALSVVTTLTGSALLALALAAGAISQEDAWKAAHVDEDWNAEFWGYDELAVKRRAFREAEMKAAAQILALR